MDNGIAGAVIGGNVSTALHGYYRGVGVTECVLRMPSAVRDEVLPVLDDYVQYIDRF